MSYNSQNVNLRLESLESHKANHYTTMKKLLLIVCAMMLSIGAFAQKGKSEVGINFDIAPTFSTEPASVNLGLGAKYRYGISNKFRLDANFTYFFNSLTELDPDTEYEYDRVSMFDISVNVHYLLKLNEKMTFYPLVGLGFIKVSPNWDFESESSGYGYLDDMKDDYDQRRAEKEGPNQNNLVFNIGAGFEYALTPHLNLNAELKFPISVDINPLPISIGVCYKF